MYYKRGLIGRSAAENGTLQWHWTEQDLLYKSPVSSEKLQNGPNSKGVRNMIFVFDNFTMEIQMFHQLKMINNQCDQRNRTTCHQAANTPGTYTRKHHSRFSAIFVGETFKPKEV